MTKFSFLKNRVFAVIAGTGIILGGIGVLPNIAPIQEAQAEELLPESDLKITVRPVVVAGTTYTAWVSVGKACHFYVKRLPGILPPSIPGWIRVKTTFDSVEFKKEYGKGIVESKNMPIEFNVSRRYIGTRWQPFIIASCTDVTGKKRQSRSHYVFTVVGEQIMETAPTPQEHKIEEPLRGLTLFEGFGDYPMDRLPTIDYHDHSTQYFFMRNTTEVFFSDALVGLGRIIYVFADNDYRAPAPSGYPGYVNLIGQVGIGYRDPEDRDTKYNLLGGMVIQSYNQSAGSNLVPPPYSATVELNREIGELSGGSLLGHLAVSTIFAFVGVDGKITWRFPVDGKDIKETNFWLGPDVRMKSSIQMTGTGGNTRPGVGGNVHYETDEIVTGVNVGLLYGGGGGWSNDLEALGYFGLKFGEKHEE